MVRVHRHRRGTARIEWAMPCRGVEYEDGDTNLFGAWVDTGLVSEFPIGVSVTSVLCIVTSCYDLGADSDHEIRRVVRAPDLAEVARGRLVFSMEPDDTGYQPLPGDERRVIHAIPTAFWAPEPGRYLFEFQLDGGEITTLPFTLQRA